MAALVKSYEFAKVYFKDISADLYALLERARINIIKIGKNYTNAALV